MEQEVALGIYVMSYQRADKIKTWHVLNDCTYVVRASEEQEYRRAGVDKLLVIPEGGTLQCGDEVCSFMTTFWWIIENTPEDVICILDDDISTFKYRLNDAVDIIKDLKDGKDIIEDELVRLAQLVVDLGLGIGCDQADERLYNYTQEFQIKGMAGAMRIINKPCLKAKYNRQDPATSDIDMLYQELLANRIILQPRYFHASTPTVGTNKGGIGKDSVMIRNFVLAMKNKWGRYYDYNFKKGQAKININR